MEELGIVVVLFAAVAVAGVCRVRGIAAPLPLVATGLVLGSLDVVERVALSPEIMLDVALPPLLFAAAYSSSLIAIRANVRPIALLSVGLVVFTTLVVGLVAWWTVPDIPFAVALAFAAALAPTDAVAASVIGRRSGLPRRTLTILEGESLLNDGTALTAFRVAVLAAVAGSVTAVEAIGILTLAIIGGVAFGVAAGYLLRRILVALHDSLLENVALLLAPFVVFATAELLRASGFLAVVFAGLVVSHHAPRDQAFGARLQGQAIWSIIAFTFESLAFFVIGLELPAVARDLAEEDVELGVIVVATLAVLAAVILTRIVWVFPATYLPRRLSRRLRERDPSPSWRQISVVAWAGMRGPVSLFAIFGLPLTLDSGEPWPERDLLILMTGCVVVGTLVLQGLTLGPLIRRLGVRADDSTADLLVEAEAQHHAAQAALARLEEELESGPRAPEAVIDRLRQLTEQRSLAAWELMGGDEETPTDAYRRLRLAMLDAEREVFLEYRDDGRLPEDVLRRVFRDLDLEEAALERG